MKYIAHRGLFQGPNTEKENTPEQIHIALLKGYDVELDVWYVDEQWYLGHDKPTYNINYTFLNERGFWIHAKNLSALYELNKDNNLNYFWHQEDDFTLTSLGYIWTYPNQPLTTNSICVMPEWNTGSIGLDYVIPKCYGICSDFVEVVKNLKLYK